MTANRRSRPDTGRSPRHTMCCVALVGALSAAATAGLSSTAFAAFVLSQACTDGSAPTLGAVSCTAPGDYTLTVPANTGTITLDIIGGGGAGSAGHTGGNGAEISGTTNLPGGTAYVFVSVGYGGPAGSYPAEGTASQIVALDSTYAFLAKLALAGAGGAGALNGNGGNAGISAGSDGTSDDPAIATPGLGGSGATGGAGGALGSAAVGGNAGQTGDTDNPTSSYPGDGGSGRNIAGSSIGSGGGGDGYGAGGSGAAGIDASSVSVYAGGGGGSSYTSSYLSAPTTTITTNTGGAATANGVDGSVNLTFNAYSAPMAATITGSTSGNTTGTVTFTPPQSDGGAPIYGYQVSTDNGTTWTTVTPTDTNPMTISLTGLSNGTTYQVLVRAVNEIGNGTPSNVATVTPAAPPVIPPPVVVPPVAPPVIPPTAPPVITPVHATVTTAASSTTINSTGTVPVTCHISSGRITRCDVTLSTVIGGKSVVIGAGHLTVAGGRTGRSLTVTVALNSTGKALANVLGGATFSTSAVIRRLGTTTTLHATGLTHLRAAAVTAPPVFFDTASSTLTTADRKILDAVRTKLTGVRSVTCDGYTDSRSNPAYNHALGMARAKAACAYLLAGTHITAVVHSYGDTNPQAANDTPTGQARNRRVDITLHY